MSMEFSDSDEEKETTSTAQPHLIDAKLEILLLRYDPQNHNKRFFELLDATKKSVLMAMYWFTYQPIAHKLIALKKKGLNVELIIDESGLKFSDAIFELLLANNITPLVFPSKKIKGIMHQKFTLLDDNTVMTGSANTTGSTLNPDSEYINNETVLVIHSKEANKKLAYEFNQIKQGIYHYYIDFAAKHASDILPSWLAKLAPSLSQTNSFKRAFYIFLGRKNISKTKKNRAKKFFKIKLTTRKSRLSRERPAEETLRLSTSQDSSFELFSPPLAQFRKKKRYRPLPKKFRKQDESDENE